MWLSRARDSLWFIFVLCAASSTAARAETRAALVIGNGAYNISIGALANSVNGTVSIASTLKRVGFEVVLKTNLDQRGMKRTILDLGRRLRVSGGGSTRLFYRGHGFQASGINYLVPIGAEIGKSKTLASRQSRQ
jgi:uncharacterized caspase-like protein